MGDEDAFYLNDSHNRKRRSSTLDLLLREAGCCRWARYRQLVRAAFAQDHAAALKMVQLLRQAGVLVNAVAIADAAIADEQSMRERMLKRLSDSKHAAR